jgi:hypothetical protein
VKPTTNINFNRQQGKLQMYSYRIRLPFRANLAAGLLFIASIAQADLLPSHAIQGGLLTGSIAKLAGGSESTCWYAFGAGAILGALPDIAGYTGSAHGDWSTYISWHSFSHPLAFVPPVALHLISDRFFHAPEGGWKSGMIPFVIGIVLVEAIVIYLFTKWVRQ